MLLDFALPIHERKLIPEGRISSSMPWIIAIMTFLTVLAGAAGLIIANAAQQGSTEIARQVTLQIVEADPATRKSQRNQLAQMLKKQSNIAAIEVVPDAQIREMLIPWLGEDIEEANIPVPSLINIELEGDVDEERINNLKEKIRPISPTAKLDSQANWIAPFFSLMNSLMMLTGGILLLLLLATAAAVMLAVRSALNSHKETLSIMHMLGGTDLQAARLFQRRMALDALLGAVVGFLVAAAIIWTLSLQFSAAGSGLLTGASMPWYGWILIALIPLGVMGLAMLIARRTAMSALKKIL